jgi:hypothetical protein
MTQAAYKTEYDKLFIGGKWVAPSTSDVIEVDSPATGEYVGKVPMAAAADVDAACAAARKAFDEFYHRYADKLFTYCKKILLDDEVAEDIFQDTFIKVIRSLKSGKYTECLMKYVISVYANCRH